VGPRDGLDKFGKSLPHRDSIPGSFSRSQSLYRLRYPDYCYICVVLVKYLVRFGVIVAASLSEIIFCGLTLQKRVHRSRLQGCLADISFSSGT
jgi:hypothetical protein